MLVAAGKVMLLFTGQSEAICPVWLPLSLLVLSLMMICIALVSARTNPLAPFPLLAIEAAAPFPQTT
jgi:hypothetical protein